MYQLLSGRPPGPVPDPSMTAMVRDLERVLAAKPRARVLLAVDGGVAGDPAEHLLAHHPEARVQVLGMDADGHEVADDRLDVVVDATSHPDNRVALFETLFPRLSYRGVYVVADQRGRDPEAGPPPVEAILWPRLVRLLDVRTGTPGDGSEPFAAVTSPDLGRVVVDGGHLLVERARPAEGAQPTASGADLRYIVRLVDDVDTPVIAVVGGSRAEQIVERLRDRIPHAEIHAFAAKTSREHLHPALAAHGRFDLVLDVTSGGKRSQRLFRAGLLHLRAGGTLVHVNHPVDGSDQGTGNDSTYWPFLVRLLGVRGTKETRGVRKDDRALAAALRRVEIGPRHLMVTHNRAALALLRDERINEVARLRNDGSIRLVAHHPPLRFESKARLPSDHVRDPAREPVTYDVPALSVREYREVVCRAGQVAVMGNLVLPESFRHHRYPRLRNRGLVPITPWFAADVPAPTTGLEGSYLYLDGELRHHFGHVTSEQVARLWAWPAAKAADPGLRLLVSRERFREERPEWEYQLFEAAGVAREDVVSFVEPVLVERMLGVTPMFSMPSYVHPDIAETWDRIGDSLESRATDRERPERLFITRAPGSVRWCHQTSEVEEIFQRRGFLILRPELLPLPDQIALIRGADVVAGFAGSGMFNLMFAATPKRTVLVRSLGYTAANEYMIASVRGHSIDAVRCRPDVAPRRRYSKEVFTSGFSFDLDTHGREVAAILDRLDAEPRLPR